VTSSLLIVALLGIGFLCAHLGRTAVLLALSYLALRHSEPDERKEILEALGPVLGAVGVTEPRAPALHADQRPVCPRYTNTASDAPTYLFTAIRCLTPATKGGGRLRFGGCAGSRSQPRWCG
jgi:hypothetical protein